MAEKARTRCDTLMSYGRMAIGNADSDDKTLIARHAAYLCAIALITFGALATYGWDALTPLETGAILIGGAVLMHLFAFGEPNDLDCQTLCPSLITAAFVALGILSILGYIPQYGVSIPLIALGTGYLVHRYCNKHTYSGWLVSHYYNFIDIFRAIRSVYQPDYPSTTFHPPKAILRENFISLLSVGLIVCGALAIKGLSPFSPLDGELVTGSIMVGGASLIWLALVGIENPFAKGHRCHAFIASLFITLGILAILGYIPHLGVAIPLTSMGALSYLYHPWWEVKDHEVGYVAFPQEWEIAY